MREHARKADRRRVVTTEFKRATVQRIVAGGKTVAELSRELDIAPSVIRNWKRFADAGATTAVQASEGGGPARRWGARPWRSRSCAPPRRSEKNAVVAQRVRTMTTQSMTAICAVLGIARRSAYYVARPRLAGRYHRADDGTVLQQIRAVTNSRATYGYRRVWAMVNRTFRTGYNRKRIRRVMQLHGLMLAPRVHRRHGRPHLGQIQQ